MSKIEDLINQYCPNGVVYDIIENICKISRGRVMSKEYLRDNVGEYPVYSSQTVNDGILGKINTYDYDGEYLTWTTDGAKAGSIFYRIGKFSITNVCGLLKVINDKVNTKFLYYYLGTVAKKYVNAGMGNPKLMSNVMATIKVAVPPMPVQEEIVKILDTYSELEAELETKLGAEIDARKKQYEYHLNQLLSFEEQDKNVKFMQLGEIGTFIKGNGLQKKDFTDSGVGCIHYGQIYTYYGTYTQQTKSFVSDELAKKLKKAQKGDLIIATTSENVEDVGKAVAWLGDESICISGDSYIFHHNQNPKYISYLFQTNMFFEQKKKYVTGVKVMRINDTAMSKFKFGFPPIEEQERIVSILDEFNKLTNEISDSLQAEIIARKKQYEYYRNKLLTFKDAV